MKKLMLMVSVAMLVVSAFAQADDGVARKRKRGGLPTGGFLTVAPTGAVVRVSYACCADRATDFAQMVEKKFAFPVLLGVEKPTTDRKIAADIILTDKKGAPVLLVAPEEAWAQVNVRPILDSTPSKILADKMIEKELWRALGYALGCANSSVQPCVMSDVDSVGAIDKAVPFYSPEAQSKIELTAKARGVQLIRYTSYRSACKEGWAPAPTNEVQQVIWEEYHSKPTEPIKIKFDPAKGI